MITDHVLIVLGGRPHHRRTADVDVLDGLSQRAVGFGYGLREGVKIDYEDVDGGYPRGADGFHVRGHVAPRQDAGMHFRMQGLDASIEHLREAGVGADLGDLQARVLQHLRGAAGGQQRDTEARQATRNLDDSGLVGDADQRLSGGGHRVDADCACERAMSASAAGRSDMHGGDAI